MKRKMLFCAIGIVILVALISSGWVYNILSRNYQLVQSNEMAILQTTFVQQYGNGATVKQLVSPEKVYAALWMDSAGISHVSWNIGGLWVTVYSSKEQPPDAPAVPDTGSVIP